jgi:hypothetical protein
VEGGRESDSFKVSSGDFNDQEFEEYRDEMLELLESHRLR